MCVILIAAPSLPSSKGLTPTAASLLIVSQLARMTVGVRPAEKKVDRPTRVYFAAADGGRCRMYTDSTQDLRTRLITSGDVNRAPQPEEVFELKWINDTTFWLYQGNYQFRFGSSESWPQDVVRSTAAADQAGKSESERDRIYGWKLVPPPAGVTRASNQAYLTCFQLNGRYLNWNGNAERISFRSPTTQGLFHICDASKSHRMCLRHMHSIFVEI